MLTLAGLGQVEVHFMSCVKHVVFWEAPEEFVFLDGVSELMSEAARQRGKKRKMILSHQYVSQRVKPFYFWLVITCLYQFYQNCGQSCDIKSCSHGSTWRSAIICEVEISWKILCSSNFTRDWWQSQTSFELIWQFSSALIVSLDGVHFYQEYCSVLPKAEAKLFSSCHIHAP
jgi:hypothetical protein